MNTDNEMSPREYRATYGKGFMSALTPERFAVVMEKLIERAEEGDLKAIQIVLDRAMGVRQSVADLSEPEQSKWASALRSFQMQSATGG